jgi:hypothetical protein
MALTSSVAWIGLERIVRRMRQFRGGALAGCWAMDVSTAVMPADSGREPTVLVALCGLATAPTHHPLWAGPGTVDQRGAHHLGRRRECR